MMMVETKMTSMLVEGMIRLVCSSLASQLLMMEMLTVAFTEFLMESVMMLSKLT